MIFMPNAPIFEFERKFIVKRISSLPFDLNKAQKADIKQGFYSGLPSPLRIRAINDEYTLTKKFVLGENKGQLEEVTLPLKKSEFKVLFPRAYKKIFKTRYSFCWHGYKVDLDVFRGKLKGLIIAEFEFASKEEMEQFLPPSFLGAEITQQEWATNSRLALLTFSRVQKILTRYEKTI